MSDQLDAIHEYKREEGIEDTLAGEERVVGRELLGDRAHLTHGPDLEHRVLSGLAGELRLEHNILRGGQHNKEGGMVDKH
jgi:hypothetical protein